MKKVTAMILAILTLCFACGGATASEEPVFYTIREALDSTEGYVVINETDDFVTLILEKDGKYYRTVTKMDISAKEIYQAALSAGNSAAFEQFDAYAWQLPVSTIEEITAAPLSQAELDALTGKTIGEIMDAWQYDGMAASDDKPPVVSLDYGFFRYSFEVDGWKGMEHEDLSCLKAKNGKLSGASRAALDLSCHADGSF